MYTCSSDLIISSGSDATPRLVTIHPDQLAVPSMAEDAPVTEQRVCLTSDIHLLARRSAAHGHHEWELSILPQLVLRNALPYNLDYVFCEIDPTLTPTSVDHMDSMDKVWAVLLGETNRAQRGQLLPGSELELSQLTLRLAYVAVRMVGHTIKPSGHRVVATETATSEWSVPILVKYLRIAV